MVSIVAREEGRIRLRVPMNVPAALEVHKARVEREYKPFASMTRSLSLNEPNITPEERRRRQAEREEIIRIALEGDGRRILQEALVAPIRGPVIPRRQILMVDELPAGVVPRYERAPRR